MRRGQTTDKIAGVLAALAILVVAAGHTWLAVVPAPKPPAPVVVPVTPTPVPVVLAEPELVIVTDASGKRITDKAVEEVAGKLAVGQWRIEAIPKPGNVGWKRSLVVSDLDVVPPIVPPVTPPVVPPVVPPVEPPKPPVVVQATAATYVYEKDASVIPPPVLAALNRLNRERKILATLFEDDTTDGGGQVPAQYEVPLKAAREAGLPALVVTAGGLVLKVVKSPTSEAQVLEAVP